MQLYFIRHGESTNNALWTPDGDYITKRTSDPELTDRGQTQAQKLAEHVCQPFTETVVWDDYHNNAGFGFTHLYSSPMVRAISTALPTAESLDLPIVSITDICEYAGIFKATGKQQRVGLAGITQAELEARFPRFQIDEPMPGEGWWNFRKEGSAELYARAKVSLDFLMEKHGEGDRVAIFSHGGFYQAFMYHVMGLTHKVLYPEPGRELGLGINNTAITRIVKRKDSYFVPYMNRTTHLTPDLISR